MPPLLNIDFNTLPGKSSYTSGSVSLNSILFIAIATEGCKEEVQYLHGIWDKCKNKLQVIRFVLLNDYYLNTEISLGHSHPSARFKALKEWRESYKKQCNINDRDVE